MRVRRALARTGVAAAALVLGFSALIGIEVLAATRRQYLPTHPPLRIGGFFGPEGGAPLTFVVLGDSTAAGVGAGDAASSYPVLLAERLAGRGRRVRLVGLGVSGARVRDVLDSQLPRALTAHPDLVLVGVGANDTTHLTRLGSVRRDMAAILDRLGRTGATVVVAGVPDMRVRAFMEPLRSLCGWRGRRVADAMREVARARGVAVVDLAGETGPYFQSHPDRHYSSDGFHPGPAGYARWADAIYPVLESALASA